MGKKVIGKCLIFLHMFGGLYIQIQNFVIWIYIYIYIYIYATLCMRRGARVNYQFQNHPQRYEKLGSY